MTFQQRNSDSPTNLQETNTLFCPAHISGSQQEAEFADHHSLDDYLGNIFQKSSCDSPNIFPPLPMTFKVVLLLPAAPDGRHKLCSRPRWFVLALAHHTHTRNWGWGWGGGGCWRGVYRQAPNIQVAWLCCAAPYCQDICFHLLRFIVWGNQFF